MLVYYRIYAEDGAIPSKTLTSGYPFVGRIKARSVPPPHTFKAVKHSIAKVEDIKDPASASLFLTPCSQSPMDDGDIVNILNGTGPGSTPEEPLALVAKMTDAERSALESGERSGLASVDSVSDTMSPEIRYRTSNRHSPTFRFLTLHRDCWGEVYYLLFANDYEMPSKVAIDPEEPSLGRIRADSVAPPHSPATIKRCISRVERNPALAQANLFADISCVAPLKDGHISILGADGPGLSPDEPLAIVQVEMATVQVESPSMPNGRYAIKNRAADVFWNSTAKNPLETVHFHPTTVVLANSIIYLHVRSILHLFKHSYDNSLSKWDITHDTNGNISIKSAYAPSSWVGANITGSTVPVPWRLIPADGKFY